MHRVALVGWVALAMAGCEHGGDGNGQEQGPEQSGKGEESPLPAEEEALTDHGDLEWEKPVTGQLTHTQLYHAWTFTIRQDGAVVHVKTESTSPGAELDTVLYLFKEVSAGAWGRAVHRNDDCASREAPWSCLEANALTTGRYRILVKGYRTENLGAFQVSATCAGAGCQTPVETHDVFEYRLSASFRTWSPGTASVEFTTVSGVDVVLQGQVALRGHSSLEECRFPKLLLTLEQPASGFFHGHKEIKIGTHCSYEDWPEPEEDKHWGNMNPGENQTHREALAYAIQAALGLPAQRVQLARITYKSTDGQPTEEAPGSEFTYKAFLLEKPKQAAERLGFTLAKFTNDTIDEAQMGRIDRVAAARVHALEALLGNSDFILPMVAGTGPHDMLLHNIDLLEDGSRYLPMPQDYDRASFVTGFMMTENALASVLGNAYQPDKGRCFNHVAYCLMWMQERSHVTEAEWAEALNPFRAQAPSVKALVEGFPLDAEGKELARCHVDALFELISNPLM